MKIMRINSLIRKFASLLFHRKPWLWHEAGLLTCLIVLPSHKQLQWYDTQRMIKYHQKLTAAGTVLDFHKIPF